MLNQQAEDYLAAQLSSSLDTNHVPTSFLQQQHCIDVPRQLLIDILPFVEDGCHPTSELAPTDYHHSRRYARYLFSNTQQLFWNTLTALFDEHKNDLEHIIMFIDMGDAFANAIWIDCLMALQQRYPEASYFPVFMFPDMSTMNAAQRANIGAAALELKQFSSKQWQPQDINTGENYNTDAPLWSAAYIQAIPKEQHERCYLNLANNIVHLAISRQQQLHATMANYCPSSQSVAMQDHDLPQFTSLYHNYVDFDWNGLNEVLNQQVELQAAKWLPYQAHTPDFFDVARLQELKLILSSAQLGLVPHAADSAWQDINAVWTLQAQDHLQSQPEGNWHTQLQQLSQHLRHVYQQTFCGVGVTRYFDVSEAAIKQVVTEHASEVEQALIQLWQDGHASLFDLKNILETLIGHDIERHQTLALQLETLAREINAYSKWFKTIEQTWHEADKATRHQLTQQYPLQQTMGKMVHAFAQRSHYQATLYASELLTGLQHQYLQLHQQLDDLIDACQLQAASAQATLTPQLSNDAPAWQRKQYNQMNCAFTLAPNQNSVEACATLLAESVQHLVADVQERCAHSGSLAAMLPILQSQWQHTDPTSPASDLHQHVLPESLRQHIVRQRIVDLDAQQIQMLSMGALGDLQKKVGRLTPDLQPLLDYQQQQHDFSFWAAHPHLKPLFENKAVRLAFRHQGLAVPNDLQNNDVAAVKCVYAHAVHLEEWLQMPMCIKAYQSYSHDETALLHLHIEGNNLHIADLQQKSWNRNRDLIRQQLLLAYASGSLYAHNADIYCLHLQATEAVYFKHLSLNDIVDHISLHDMKSLLHKHEQEYLSLQNQTQLIQSNLKSALRHIQAETLSNGKLPEDASWQEAGSFIAWNRAAKKLQKRWFSHNDEVVLQVG
ncbi:hypothetical protein LVJ82_00915 [Vitreoscilla massiliensis]|uniref:Uncharacterized protein n=1 Tax=Vitreoscilla massiliensis TaxID=1689272 RepID=A0ABY4E1A1_9NEIS|nr:hypothetical protein [Vitreoscilla massiliensis]UOO89576.1 hypothetical protein LVJ82_00915 [Vitreoscilla massiliensis]